MTATPSAARKSQRRACLVHLAVCIATGGLSACGGGDPIDVSTEPGPSPFISLMHLQGVTVSALTGVEYTIAPKPGTVSKPVHVEYSLAALQARGYVTGAQSLTVPIFGLYAGYSNQVSVQLDDQANHSRTLEVTISTAAYTDPSGIYTQPNVTVARAPGSDLGFDFIYLKSALGSPVIIDTDAQVRWAAPANLNAQSSALVGDEFVIGDGTQPTVHRLLLDGTGSDGPLPAGDYKDFNHDITTGKSGLLAEVDTSSNGVTNLESNVVEITTAPSNSILNRWDLGAILSAYMSSHGDDPTTFVRPGVDWFHSNSAIYDSSDDSVIVSSRENFVIKLDYSTGTILWILGDPTKYWYTFPSLRAKALTLAAGGLYPIGQHGLSITSDGLLMLFNDGQGSYNQPLGAPVGETRTYSTVSAYSIDPTLMTAQEVWDYDAGQAIFSSLCSSAYEATGKSLLVDYAFAYGSTAILIGLNSAHQTVFTFEYPTTECNTAWNARPLPLEDFRIDQ